MSEKKTPDAPLPAEVQDVPTYDASTLTAGGQLAWIKHEGQVYTLRITRAEKLILTK